MGSCDGSPHPDDWKVNCVTKPTENPRYYREGWDDSTMSESRQKVMARSTPGTADEDGSWTHCEAPSATGCKNGKSPPVLVRTVHTLHSDGEHGVKIHRSVLKSEQVVTAHENPHKTTIWELESVVSVKKCWLDAHSESINMMAWLSVPNVKKLDGPNLYTMARDETVSRLVEQGSKQHEATKLVSGVWKQLTTSSTLMVGHANDGFHDESTKCVIVASSGSSEEWCSSVTSHTADDLKKRDDTEESKKVNLNTGASALVDPPSEETVTVWNSSSKWVEPSIKHRNTKQSSIQVRTFHDAADVAIQEDHSSEDPWSIHRAGGTDSLQMMDSMVRRAATEWVGWSHIPVKPPTLENKTDESQVVEGALHWSHASPGTTQLSGENPADHNDRPERPRTSAEEHETSLSQAGHDCHLVQHSAQQTEQHGPYTDDAHQGENSMLATYEADGSSWDEMSQSGVNNSSKVYPSNAGTKQNEEIRKTCLAKTDLWRYTDGPAVATDVSIACQKRHDLTGVQSKNEEQEGA